YVLRAPLASSALGTRAPGTPSSSAQDEVAQSSCQNAGTRDDANCCVVDRPGRRRNVQVSFGGRRATAQQLQLQALLTLLHCPAVIRLEQRTHEGLEHLQQRLLGADPPVVGRVHEPAVLRDGPEAAANEVPCGFDGE